VQVKELCTTWHLRPQAAVLFGADCPGASCSTPWPNEQSHAIKEDFVAQRALLAHLQRTVKPAAFVENVIKKARP